MALLTLVLPILLLSSPSISATTVSIDASNVRNTLDAWGTSLCWWANGVGGWGDDDTFGKLMSTIFDAEDGLGINLVRYNIGGGGSPDDQRFLRPGGEVQGYQLSNGTFDWTADATQRRVLLESRKHGVNTMHAFSNSPPYWMTKSGSVTGATDGGNNLRDDMYPQFANYLATVVKHFQTSSDYGNIVFDAVTPLNEPCSPWWKYGGDQEGCHFDRDKEDQILSLLAQYMQKLGINGTVLSGPEENSIDDTLASLNSYSNATIAALSLITTHTYNGDNRQGLSQFAHTHNKRLWNSEFGTGSGPLQGGIQLAQRITTDLNNMNITAWTLWQVVDLDNTLSPDGWGLIAATYEAPGDTYTIRTGTLCATVSNPASGAGVTLQACDGSSSQTWTLDPSSATITSLVGGYCWDDWGQGMHPGDAVRVDGCWGGANQKWSVVGDGTIRLNNFTGICVSAPSTQPQAGDALIVNTCSSTPTASQLFTLTAVNTTVSRTKDVPSSPADQYSRVRHPATMAAVRMNAPDEFVIRKQYYAYKQFTSFIRPGSRLLPLSDPNTVAAISPQGSLVLVYTNANSSPASVTFKMSHISTASTASVYITDDSSNCTPGTPIPVTNGTFTASIGSNSIVTFLL